MPTVTGYATDFITFSRASNATVTDSNGYIKWAAHNLLTNSESFDASAWTKYNGGPGAPTLTAANAAAAPNGTTTADDFLFPAISSAAQETLVIQQLAVAAGSYTGGVWVKAKAAGDVGKRFTLTAYDTGAANVMGRTHYTLTADWFFVTVSGTATAATIQFNFGSVGSSLGGGNQDAFSCFVWGAHLYRSDLGGMVANTSAYPYYNPTTPKNLLGYTEAFDNAYWTKSGLAATPVLTNVLNGPNGLPTADKMVENSSASTHILFATVTVADGPKTFSVYAKAAERSWVFLRAGANIGAYFNLSAGSVGTADAGVTASIVSAGDGWYRCAITLNIAAGLTYPTIFISTGNGTTSYTGDGTSGIYLWGAQLSDSASLDAYSPVYGAAVTSAAYYAPRLDYSGSSLAALGLLVEEQRTNVLLHSNDFSQAAWADAAPGSVVTVAANSTASPDGSTNAAKLTASTGGTNAMARQARTLVASTVYSGSIYIKGDTSTQSRMLLRDTTSGVNFADATINWSAGVPTIAGGATGTWSAVPVGGNWYRIVGTGTTGASPTPSVTFSLFPDTAAGTNAIFAYGAQLEAGSFATSYIPTTSASVTRSADVAQVSTQAFPYADANGTLVVSSTLLALSTAAIQSSANLGTDGNNQIYLYANNTAGSRDAVITTSGVGQGFNSIAGASSTSVTKQAFAWATNDTAHVVNASAPVTDASVSLPTGLQSLRLGVNTSNANALNGHIRQITYIPRRLTNAELQQRTSA